MPSRVLHGPEISGIGLWPLVLLNGVHPVGFLAPVWAPCRLTCRHCLPIICPRLLRPSHVGWKCHIRVTHPGMRRLCWGRQVIRWVLRQVSGHLIGQALGHSASGMLLRCCLPCHHIRPCSLQMMMLIARARPGLLLAELLFLSSYPSGGTPAMQIIVQVLVPVSMDHMLPWNIVSWHAVRLLWTACTAINRPWDCFMVLSKSRYEQDYCQTSVQLSV